VSAVAWIAREGRRGGEGALRRGVARRGGRSGRGGEGHTDCVSMLRRQMFGRVCFGLLRKGPVCHVALVSDAFRLPCDGVDPLNRVPLLSQSVVLAPVESNSLSPSCDCLAHRFGNAADGPDRTSCYGSE
jgi:hypothetical protein